MSFVLGTEPLAGGMPLPLTYWNHRVMGKSRKIWGAMPNIRWLANSQLESPMKDRAVNCGANCAIGWAYGRISAWHSSASPSGANSERSSSYSSYWRKSSPCPPSPRRLPMGSQPPERQARGYSSRHRLAKRLTSRASRGPFFNPTPIMPAVHCPNFPVVSTKIKGPDNPHSKFRIRREI